MQLYGEVRQHDSSSQTAELDKLQIAQNYLLRTLENVRIRDKISVKSMLDSQQMLSVNQTHAQIKILEVWKALNVENNPNKVSTISHDNTDRITRGLSAGLLQENSTPQTCLGDAIRLWNKAPDCVRLSSTLAGAKKASKIYCKSFPI